jgi:hypothetical protein
MNGDAISAAVLTQVRRACGRRKKPIVTREFSLGRSPVRADLAILGDEFIGIEVKGDRDTLRRLPKQMEGYAACFERTILVVANRHLKHIDRDSLCGAALWSFDIEGNLSEKRSGAGLNCVSGQSYLDMMTQEERRKFLVDRPDAATDLDQSVAKAAFLEAFSRRYQQKSLEFWSATARRHITSADLPMLSRFLEKRNEVRRIAEDRDEFWQRWADQNAHQEP